VRESGIPREEIHITTKLTSSHHGRVAEALEESLARGGFDYYDLYLMHWPMGFHYRTDGSPSKKPDGTWDLAEHPTFSETWADMEKLLGTGKVRAIGVSNFSIKTLEILLKTAKVVPAVNQVELHPLLGSHDLLKYCKEKGIMLTAYTPTGFANVRDHPEMVKIAKKHGVSSAQATLAWHVQRGTTACPKSANVERQKENINLPKLDAEDMKTIDGLDQNKRLGDFGPQTGPDILVNGWTFEQLGW